MFFKSRRQDREHWTQRVFGATLGAVVLFLIEILQVVIVAAVIIIPIRYFLIQPFVVNGASMENNFFDSEYLIIDEVTYRLRDANRGEVVVFRPPKNESQFYIKRVIGLPGETVEINDGVITIFNQEFPNGFKLNESYISDYTSGHDRITLAYDEYYLLGDNRDQSLDSRVFGPVKKSSIVGRAWLRGLPIDRLGTINIPEYSF